MTGQLDDRALSRVRWVAGCWFESFDVLAVADALAEPHPTAIYLLADSRYMILHLGQVRRSGGLGSRVREHLRVPARASTTAVGVVRLDPWTASRAVDAIEGKAAEVLGLRQYLPGDRWPSCTQWAELTASRSAEVA